MGLGWTGAGALAGALAVALTAHTPPPPAGARVPHYDGPPPGHTGGFGEPTCRACHEGDELNAYGGSVTILGLPEAWEPGAVYPLTVVLEAEETSLAGFQLSARFAHGGSGALAGSGPPAGSGAPAGSWAPLDDRVEITPGEGGQPYAHHTPQGTTVADPSGSSWVLQWTAPGSGGGNPPAVVVFNVAANSANGDNSPLLDLVYAAEFRVPPAGE